MMDLHIEATFAGDKTLEELRRLLARREEVLGESAKDAVIATAITALTSIRTATTSAAKRSRFKHTVEDTGWYGGFAGAGKRRVIRAGAGKGAAEVAVPTKRVKWLTSFQKKQKRRKVWKVTPEHGDKVRPYYVVAESKKKASDFEKKAALRRTAEYGGLAKNALGVAMNKLSTRNVGLNGARVCKNAASRLATVETGGAASTDTYVIVTDNLVYAALALKGGRSAVDTALKKAANKIAGQLAQAAKRTGLEEKFESPFPEVKKRR